MRQGNQENSDVDTEDINAEYKDAVGNGDQEFETEHVTVIFKGKVAQTVEVERLKAQEGVARDIEPEHETGPQT